MKSATLKKIKKVLLLIGIALVISACGKGYEDYEIEGLLTMAPYKGWRELEIRSDKIDADKQKYTKFIKGGKKLIQFKKGSSNATILIMTPGRVPIAQYSIPGDKFNEKTETFFATSYELHQQYNLGGGRIKRVTRKETVDKKGYAKSCTVQSCYKDYDAKTKSWKEVSCPGLKGNVWYVEDSRYDYVLNFTILDPKDPKNLVAQFVGQGEVHTEAKEYNDTVCRPRLKMYAMDGRLDPALTRVEGEATK